ncbi:hypothetical protein BKA70DRAFT_1424487 [Coprinopsis sp. MPI-PUGE-AT-0042]|nr:hypothetical protein BKA70DRAFT_1424487 [Coprinopsis sp. MPI-PUGE-AT-0042]
MSSVSIINNGSQSHFHDSLFTNINFTSLVNMSTPGSAATNPKATETGGNPPTPYSEIQSMVVRAYKEFEKKYTAASKAFADALSGSATSAAFVKDMDSLQLTIGRLNTLFDNVHMGLATVDAEKLKGQDGKVTAWQLQWSIIRTEYLDTMMKSRSLATSLSNHCEMFYKNILPKLKGDTLTAQQKEEMLTYFVGEKVNAPNYNEALKWDEKAAEQLYKDFLDIRTKVATFKAKFDTSFKLTHVSSLQSNFAKLEAELEALTAKRKVSVIAGSLDSLEGDVATAVLQKQISDTQVGSNGEQAEPDAASTEQDPLNMALEPLIVSPNKETIEIGAKLETMKSIWAFVKSQARIARQEVQKPAGSEVSPILKEEMIDARIQAYKVLGTSIKVYRESA